MAPSSVFRGLPCCQDASCNLVDSGDLIYFLANWVIEQSQILERVCFGFHVDTRFPDFGT